MAAKCRVIDTLMALVCWLFDMLMTVGFRVVDIEMAVKYQDIGTKNGDETLSYISSKIAVYSFKRRNSSGKMPS